MRDMLGKFIFAVVTALLAFSAVAKQGVHTWQSDQNKMTEIEQSISAFFGKTTGAYISLGDLNAATNGHVSEKNAPYLAYQFQVLFSNVPGIKKNLGNSMVLYSYSLVGSGKVRGAVVLDDKRSGIDAAGLISFMQCSSLSKDASRTEASKDYIAKVHKKRCLDVRKPVLTVFTTQSLVNDQSRARLAKTGLVEWATSELIGYSPAVQGFTVYFVAID